MNAFEQLAATLMKQAGYWVYPNFKVEFSKEEKVSIGRHSSPRWELDLVAYKPITNTILAVECKAYLDSTGTSMNGFINPKTDRYKLLNDEHLRKVVFHRMKNQLIERGLVLPDPTVNLALMAAKIRKSDRASLAEHFSEMKWELFDPDWIRLQLHHMSEGAYENEVSAIVAKLLLRSGS